MLNPKTVTESIASKFLVKLGLRHFGSSSRNISCYTVMTFKDIRGTPEALQKASDAGFDFIYGTSGIDYHKGVDVRLTVDIYNYKIVQSLPYATFKEDTLFSEMMMLIPSDKKTSVSRIGKTVAAIKTPNKQQIWNALNEFVIYESARKKFTCEVDLFLTLRDRRNGQVDTVAKT